MGNVGDRFCRKRGHFWFIRINVDSFLFFFYSAEEDRIDRAMFKECTQGLELILKQKKTPKKTFSVSVVAINGGSGFHSHGKH